uniref:Uncharacterized protein n=1 Tax=Tanacetum cinerariifolium TaxID=118510 RepID=A0A699I117_TANCI|nr:hypothetical protein [Tanacetum cinerariifolium]
MAQRIIPAAQLKTVSKVPDSKDTIKFKLATQEIIYIVDMFRDTLHLLVKTPNNPFIAPVNIEIIQSFMKRVGYHGIVDKCLYNGDYDSSRDNDFGCILTDEIRATDDYKETTPRAHRTPTLIAASPQEKKRKQSTRETSSPIKSLKVTIKQNWIEPGSYKEYPKHVDDDDENVEEKKDDEMGSLENRTKKMQTPIPTPPRSHRIYISSDDIIDVQTSRIYDQGHGKKIATNDLIEANLKRDVTDSVIQERDAFQSKVPALISKELDAQAPKIIEELFKIYVQNNVIQVHPTTTSSTATTSSADLP